MSILDKIRGGVVSYSMRGRRNVPPAGKIVGFMNPIDGMACG